MLPILYIFILVIVVILETTYVQNGRIVYGKEFKGVIGKDDKGNDLKKVRVIVEQDGTLVTAFPQKIGSR